MVKLPSRRFIPYIYRFFAAAILSRFSNNGDDRSWEHSQTVRHLQSGESSNEDISLDLDVEK